MTRTITDSTAFRIGFVFVVLLLLLPFFHGCARIRPPKGVGSTERTMEVTGYCKCGECCGWKRTWYGKAVVASGPNKGKRKKVGVTASGAKARVGTVAADTSIYPFGTIVFVPGYGYGRVEDRGSAIQGGKLDLFFGSHKEATKWGRKTVTVKIWKKRK